MGFESLGRQEFRAYFQPSRILLGVVPAPTKSGVNLITLCFNTHCSYKPPMIAVAIHKRSATYKLIQRANNYVLSVPGESLSKETLFCGTVSMREVDKVEALGIVLRESEKISVPSVARAIANAEMERVAFLPTGDHVLVVGRVLRFAVNTKLRELPLLSFGPRESGYRLLCRKGIHRIGTVDAHHIRPGVDEHR